MYRQSWSNGGDHGSLWPSKLVAARYHAVEGAKRVATLALDVVSGAGLFKSEELEHIMRDVVLGPVHPANSSLVH